MRARRFAHAAVLSLAGMLLCACAQPLGPGYAIKKQQFDLQWTGTSDLAFRAAYEVQNTGTHPLDYIEVTLPPESQRSSLRILFDGAPVSIEPADPLSPKGAVRIPFRPAWPMKKKSSLVIEYRLADAAHRGATESFYLPTKGWYPGLLPREGLFSSGGVSLDDWDLRITVPRDFLVHASGEAKGKKHRGDAVEHRFRQRPGRDFDPFIVAGRYHEQRAPSPGSDVILWSFTPVPQAALHQIAEWMGQTAQHYRTVFGPLGNSAEVRVAELPPSMLSPVELESEETQSEKMDPLPVEPNFPGGVLLPAGELNNGSNIEAILHRLDGQLALSWFHFGVTASPESGLLFYQGLPLYAAAVADEARGNTGGRTSLTSACFELYAGMGGEAEEPRFFLNEGTVTLKRVGYARAKAPLFFLALEDRYGKGATRRSLARLVDSLRGREYNTNDLRAAIKLETGEDPVEFFRLWLNQPGIPEEFRKKYEGQGPGVRD